ncbi:hypothetical protein SAV31267_051190 [Streptomyces avermitilis]|uniref:Uncharacterized protein n=1 Tax=Streptomyces avermitilis TaxID=33903 RepID=A0A4D4MV71_STRAX|nr:hypothetical protein SAV31267_051190 [Streptomyces avermitilis]
MNETESETGGVSVGHPTPPPFALVNGRKLERFQPQAPPPRLVKLYGSCAASAHSGWP